MKVWKYYLVPNKDSAKREYELYAFTNKKEYANKFEEDRDMKKFVKADVIDIDKEDYLDFANSNKDQLLDYYKYETKFVDENNTFDIGVVTVLSTYSEYAGCSREAVEDMLFDVSLFETIPDYRMFTKDIKKSLRTLEFISMYKIMKNNPIMDDVDDDFAAPDVVPDEFKIFISLYQYLFK